MEKKPKSVTWADDFDKKLKILRTYTPKKFEKEINKEFKSYYEITHALGQSKSNQRECDRVLEACNLEKNGTIANIRFIKNGWFFDVRFNGYLIDDIYECSVEQTNDDEKKLFDWKVKHCATVPNTTAFCSLIVGAIGGAMVTLSNLK
ncbi:hypothetical protein HYX58_03140 [Candidatus Dependentiae bacterium]|nr:hypothetical protein [Candidatus Dependentiae bacterium]